MSNFEPYVCMQTNSKCYKNTVKFKPVGVLWHTTGANNPNIKRYVQPTDGSVNYAKDISKFGKNTNRNDWNHLQVSAGVNAFIGKYADGSIGTVQCLPWDYAPWGCGSGSRGSCNKEKMADNSYIGWIQFEICEDNLSNADYANKVFNEAVQLTAYLCKKYGIDPDGYVTIKGVKIPTITCHNDASKLGFATNHADINHWFPKLIGKNMNNARQEVKALVGGGSAPSASSAPAPAPVNTSAGTSTEMTVKVIIPDLNIRKEPSMKGAVVGVTGKGTFTIVKTTSDGWGLLKSKAGWIYLNNPKYVTKGGSSTPQTAAPAATDYKVQVTASALRVRKGPGLNYGVVELIRRGEVYTIVETKNGWGKLKSGKGWIALEHTKKV